MLNLINHEPDINKIYSYAKDPCEVKYQFLINNRESTGLKYLNFWKAFIEYSDDMDDNYKNIEEYNPNEKQKILIVFDEIFAVMLSNKKRNPIVTELFIRGKKVNISVVFITQSYFAVPKNIRLNSTHYCFIMKFPDKRELQQFAFNRLSDIGFMDLYKTSTAKPYSSLVIDTNLAPDNLLHFRRIF